MAEAAAEAEKPLEPQPQPQQGDVEEKAPAKADSFAPTPPQSAAAHPIPSFSSLSLSLWPPSQRTRSAVLKRLVETLSTPSSLTARYGSFSQDEAADVAQKIEEDAFSLASSSPTPSPDDDGMATLQIYSREISKRMLEAVKCRATASPVSASAPAPAAAPASVEVSQEASSAASGSVPGAGSSEEISSVESSQA